MKRNMNTKVALAALLCMPLYGCATNTENVAVLPIEDFSVAKDYKIEAGDELDVKFYYTQDLNDRVTVRPDGKISLQLVDDVKAEGRTPAYLDDVLTSLYTEKLPDKPDISVIVRSFGDQRVYVSGEVARPGELQLKNKMTILQAITAAGGFLNTAGRDAVLIVRQDDTGASHIYKANLTGEGIIKGEAESSAHAQLMPRDTVFIVKSGIAEADLAVDQYVRQLLLFNGVSVGASGIYELNDAD